MTILQQIVTNMLQRECSARVEVFSFINADRYLRYQGVSSYVLRPDKYLYVTAQYNTEWAARWVVLINTYMILYDRERTV